MGEHQAAGPVLGMPEAVRPVRVRGYRGKHVFHLLFPVPGLLQSFGEDTVVGLLSLDEY